VNRAYLQDLYGFDVRQHNSESPLFFCMRLSNYFFATRALVNTGDLSQIPVSQVKLEFSPF
jgi:hypothetical protein